MVSTSSANLAIGEFVALVIRATWALIFLALAAIHAKLSVALEPEPITNKLPRVGPVLPFLRLCRLENPNASNACRKPA